MIVKQAEADQSAETEVQVTNCPECGTEWEVVVTQRVSSPRSSEQRQG